MSLQQHHGLYETLLEREGLLQIFEEQCSTSAELAAIMAVTLKQIGIKLTFNADVTDI
jgi:hypothetical protein